MVSRPVVGGQTGSVEHKRNGQLLQANLLKDLVKATLQKSTVDINDRSQTNFGLSRRKRHRMRLANPNIEEPIGILLANWFQLIALAHRRRDHGNFFVVIHLVGNRITSMIRVGHGR